jgi:hypothetical protein
MVVPFVHRYYSHLNLANMRFVTLSAPEEQLADATGSFDPMKLLDFPPKAEPPAMVATTFTIELIDSKSISDSGAVLRLLRRDT